MKLPDAVTDAQLKGMNLVHRLTLAATGGRVGRRLGSMPVVELHTTGRTSGKRRSVMLTVPVADDGRWILVASKGGDDRDPDWYRNLVATPEAELTVDGALVPIVARTATAEEKAELWPRIVAAYRGYAGYQQRTGRDIPVVVCTRR